MTREQRAKVSAVLRYIVLVLVGVIMVYPLIWMVGATFKTNSEIFTSAWFWPKNPVFDGYSQAFKSYGGKIDLLHSMLNTYKIVIPKVIFTLVSATITAYGFARFNFKGKNIFFALLMCTLFLPQVVLNAPQYIMFNKWGWTDSYLPLVIPSLFACDTYFVFMLNQFLRGIPKELEEAAKIDGCNAVQTLWYVIVPMLKPSLVSCALFQFMWTSNDFQGPLIYLSTMTKYTNSIYLRMSMDGDVGFQWNRILAMSLISIIPSLIVFFASQNSFVEGISAGGVKG
jgi:oligogalacturonide transport system permease protein